MYMCTTALSEIEEKEKRLHSHNRSQLVSLLNTFSLGVLLDAVRRSAVVFEYPTIPLFCCRETMSTGTP